MFDEDLTLAQVLGLLNEGTDLQEVADNLNIKISILESKLTNAAVVNENGVWMYKGGNEITSLNRPVKKKVKVINADKEFLGIEIIKNTSRSEEHIDADYELYKDCREISWADLVAKKSFHLQQELYDVIKQTSVEKSIKFNVLVNSLLLKGLEHYRLK
ncbi:hypothetical protein [Solibacillus daqui]|uniref:hypothetical protein n=1 Tax=Solibacillus daqui TaxID=2912187 RepID=UPI0023658D4F|nr:hypothetical protein [Solibacillus daqui]